VKELPLFDAQVPIACTIDAAQRPARRDLLEKMRVSTVGVERTGSGVLLSFPPSADGLFEEFTVLEKRCCAFFGFGFESGELRWEAPPDALPIMDAVYRFFSDPNCSLDTLELLIG
jgi:hypothetical protein